MPELLRQPARAYERHKDKKKTESLHSGDHMLKLLRMLKSLSGRWYNDVISDNQPTRDVRLINLHQT